MRQKSIVKLIIFVIVLLFVVALIVFMMNNFFKKNNEIPYGVYAVYENGSIIETSSEYMWIIDSKCTYLYSEYEIVKKEDGLFFSNSTDLIKFEYNETNKELTVYYPIDFKANYTEDVLIKRYKRK